MPRSAVEILRQFGALGDDQRYTRLVDLFADDAVYYDPLLGPQIGKDAIRRFMEHKEKAVPKSGTRFGSWETRAALTCGWARWHMYVPDVNGDEAPVPGQSLFRVRDGQVTFVADYLDCRSYRTAQGPEAKVPNHADSLGVSSLDDKPTSVGLKILDQFWTAQNDGRHADLASMFADDGVYSDILAGQFRGREAIAGYFARVDVARRNAGATFELVDAAADDTVGWSQWNTTTPGGVVPGWTLHTFCDGEITLNADYFDTNAAASALE